MVTAETISSELVLDLPDPFVADVSKSVNSMMLSSQEAEAHVQLGRTFPFALTLRDDEEFEEDEDEEWDEDDEDEEDEYDEDEDDEDEDEDYDDEDEEDEEFWDEDYEDEEELDEEDEE